MRDRMCFTVFTVVCWHVHRWRRLVTLTWWSPVCQYLTVSCTPGRSAAWHCGYSAKLSLSEYVIGLETNFYSALAFIPV